MTTVDQTESLSAAFSSVGLGQGDAGEDAIPSESAATRSLLPPAAAAGGTAQQGYALTDNAVCGYRLHLVQKLDSYNGQGGRKAGRQRLQNVLRKELFGVVSPVGINVSVLACVSC